MSDKNENGDIEPTTGLRRMLEELTVLYSEGNRKIEVEFTDGTPHITPDGQKIAVNTDVQTTIGRDIEGVQQLRIILDTLSHEVAHDNYSDLESKGKIAKEYPKWSKLAGHVANILEDQYIDRQRLIRNPGLRGAHAFTIDTMMSNGHRRPPMDSKRLSKAQTYVEGMTQVAFAGYAKNIDNAPQDVREFLAWFRPKVAEVEREDDPDARMDIFREVVEKLIDYLPEDERDDVNEYADEDGQSDTSDTPEPQDDGGGEGEGDESDEDSNEDDNSDEDPTGSGGDGSAPGSGSDRARDVAELLGDEDPNDCEVILDA